MMISRRIVVLAVIGVLAAAVAGISAPAALAWTCGGSIEYTNQTAYDGTETITVSVFDGAPAPTGVQVGPYHWSKTSTHYYPDHITTFWTYAYQARGTYNVWVNVGGRACFNADGQFTIY